MAKIIIINNKFAQFISPDAEIVAALRKHLSYKMAGVEYSPAYQNYQWDGITYLMSQKGVFYLGLLDEVRDFLVSEKIVFEEEDRRTIPVKNDALDLSPSLARLNLVPRDYQLQIANLLTSNSRGIVKVATGGGKTLIAALSVAGINSYPVIIYVIGLDLLNQFHKLFSSLFNQKIGYLGNGECDIGAINIATAWTIGRSLKLNVKDIVPEYDEEYQKENFNENHSDRIVKLIKSAKVHIFDESQYIVAKTFQTIYKNLDNAEYIYGLSATPFREDNSELLIEGILGKQLVSFDASYLIERNYLVQPIIKFISTPPQSMPLGNYPMVYKKYIVENEIRNQLIVEGAKTLIKKGYKTLVLFKQINHGKILSKLMEENGIKCSMLYGNDSLDRREEIKQHLLDGKIELLLASSIYDQGVDLPPISGLILAGGGRARGRALQRIGRVIRPFPGKKSVAILDFYDQIKFLKKHSSIRYHTYLAEAGFKVIKSKEMK